MAKWVKQDSSFATGSRGRITRAVRTDNQAAAKKETKQNQQANPKGTKGGYGKKTR